MKLLFQFLSLLLHLSCVNGLYGDIVILIPGQTKILNICEVEAFDSSGKQIQLGNARQSSVYVEWSGPEKVIDGNNTTEFDSKSCMHTVEQTNPKLELSVMEDVQVATLRIFNRYESLEVDAERRNARRLIGAVITYKNRIVYEVEAGLEMYDISVGDFFVYNDNPSNPIVTLCEFTPIGTGRAAIPLTGAHDFPYSANYIASTAIDGDTTTILGPSEGPSSVRKCSHTLASDPPHAWWQARSENPQFPREITVIGRGDCCTERINNNKVYYRELWIHTLTGFGESQTQQTFKVPDIYLNRNNDEVLHIAEVEAFDVLNNTIELENAVLYPKRGDDPLRAASKAIDGDYNNFAETTKSRDAVWMANTKIDTPVSRIRIYNRKDCCDQRIIGVQVWYKGVLMHTITSVEEFYDIEIPDIQIIIPSSNGANSLKICSVQAYDYNMKPIRLKEADQSSVSSNYGPSRAIDMDEDCSGNSFSQTNSQVGPWWSAMISGNSPVHKIKIENTEAIDALIGANVYVRGELVGSISQPAKSHEFEVNPVPTQAPVKSDPTSRPTTAPTLSPTQSPNVENVESTSAPIVSGCNNHAAIHFLVVLVSTFVII